MIYLIEDRLNELDLLLNSKNINIYQIKTARLSLVSLVTSLINTNENLPDHLANRLTRIFIQTVLIIGNN